MKNKIKKIHGVYNELVVSLKEKLKIPIFRMRLIFLLDLLYKSILFTTIIESKNAVKINFLMIPYKFIFPYLAFIILIFGFGYLFSRKREIVYHFVVNIGLSILLIMDLSYFRSNRDVLSLKHIFFKGTFNPVNEGLINIKFIDVLFIIDSIIILIYYLHHRISINEKRNKNKFRNAFIISIFMMIISHICIDVFPIYGNDKAVFKTQWDTLMSERCVGPIGYHIVDSIKTLTKIDRKPSNSEKEKVNKWIKYNDENLEPNQYYGAIKGKNIIFLQIESLENFVINKRVNGQEITPFLNKLTKSGLYFDNFYEQNNAGNSIDCDFLVNTSVYPLGDKITSLYYGENVYSNSLSRIVEKKGYTTITTHAEDIGSFNWTELHKNGFGVEQLWDIKKYNYNETVGYGLSDRSFYSQVVEKIKKVDRPFFLQLATLSSHGPFKINQKYRTLNLPYDIDQSYLGGYFESVKYADTQIRMLFDKLDKGGLLDNTTIVIYGDHGGVHKYYNEEIQDLNFDNNWWKNYDNKIPLIIYSKGLEPKVVNAAGGQVDILPTISYLLGIDKSEYINTSMGRVLVNTNRNATVIKGNVIKGNVQSEEERKHLLEAYEIGKIIIEEDVFNK